MAIIHALLALSSVAAVLTADTVQAQGLPPEGPVSVTFTATQIPPPKPMPIGDGKEFVVINQAMAASNDAGKPVRHNMAGRWQMSFLSDTYAKTGEMHAFCTYADQEGDQIFLQFEYL